MGEITTQGLIKNLSKEGLSDENLRKYSLEKSMEFISLNNFTILQLLEFSELIYKWIKNDNKKEDAQSIP